MFQGMGLPSESVTLSAQEVAELHKQLRDMRHDINNHLCYIVAALEIMRKPEKAEEMRATVTKQALKIPDQLKQFSLDLERKLGITKP
jgi:hypothetical protein